MAGQPWKDSYILRGTSCRVVDPNHPWCGLRTLFHRTNTAGLPTELECWLPSNYTRRWHWLLSHHCWMDTLGSILADQTSVFRTRRRGNSKERTEYSWIRSHERTFQECPANTIEDHLSLGSFAIYDHSVYHPKQASKFKCPINQGTHGTTVPMVPRTRGEGHQSEGTPHSRRVYCSLPVAQPCSS